MIKVNSIVMCDFSIKQAATTGSWHHISYPLIQKYEFLFSDARSVLLTLDECGVHDVTGVLKQYLRQLPDPVIPGTMYKQFISAGSKY